MVGPFENQRRVPEPSGVNRSRRAMRTEYGKALAPSTLPPSPTALRTGTYYGSYPQSGLPHVTQSDISSPGGVLSLSFSTSEWVGLIRFAVYGVGTDAVQSLSYVSVDGTPISQPRNWGAITAETVIDIYGYGRSVTAGLNVWSNTARLNIAPVFAQTHITPTGSVVAPPALTGDTVNNVL